ncbi:hypothetical protein COE51_11275 [Bacillus pseudomycoides]|nr:hypothetical protein COE51_11275 [Bacillus pseudomycoides]
MKMLKWLVLFVFSLSFITGCSQNEVKTDKKTAAKQTEQKEEQKQEQQSSEEQKQEEKSADSKSIEQNLAQKQNAEQSQNQEQNTEQPQNQENKTQSQEKSKVVNEPKETPKQENTQQTSENQQSTQVHSEGTPSPVQPAPEPKPEPKPEVKTVTLSVRDDQSTILGGTEVELQEGDTVFKVLARTMKQKGIQMEYIGSGSSIYVRGINNLYEKDKGDLSGWMYRVNGVVINESAGRHKVKQGDKVEWLYTKDSGKDIGK